MRSDLIVVQKMLSLQESSCISDITTQTSLLVEIVSDMAHQLPIKEMKRGGHSQDATEPIGGSTFLKT